MPALEVVAEGTACMDFPLVCFLAADEREQHAVVGVIDCNVIRSPLIFKEDFAESVQQSGSFQTFLHVFCIFRVGSGVIKHIEPCAAAP